jgi:predicted DsbA family dithiol-disulfide isomerase
MLAPMNRQTAATLRVPIQLEVFFDLSCPFSFLGKLQLDRVLQNATIPVDIVWSPVILHPSIPPGGLDLQQAHGEKYGERSRTLQAHVERMFESFGVKLDHRRIKKVPNTFDAHRTVRFAAASGRTEAMIEAILRGYFLEGRDIGNRHDLSEIVRTLGLDVADFRARMASDWQRAELLAEAEKSVRSGARSVPSYRLEGVHVENTVDLIPELRRLTAG